MDDSTRAKRAGRLRRILRYAAIGMVLFVVLGVWVSQQFPALTHGRKSSLEILQAVFKAPISMPADAAQAVFKRVKKEAVALFVSSCDVPTEARDRVVAMIRGERFETVTVPFVYYLYELYGAPAAGEPESMADLAYAEPPAPPKVGGPGLSALVLESPAMLKYVSGAVRLFDALFLELKPGATLDDPVSARYDEASYENVKAVVRQLASELLSKPSDAIGEEKSEYVVFLEETLRDDARLSQFIEFFTDLVRQLSDSWLRSFVEREKRKELRLAWVEEKTAANRYFEIADYARGQAERKLVFHLAVDGLQGKLLEGLAQLSSGDRASSGARYVTDLVRLHQTPRFEASAYEPRQPPGLGKDVVELVERSPNRPDYLETFKKHFFSPAAQAVIVNVATVDTPTISVRNLPLIYSGHPVAGRFGTGIPNFSYLDRRTGRGWYFWGSDMLHMQNIFKNREELIPKGQKRPMEEGARTLFERLWRYNTVSGMATVDTGALEKISSEVGVAAGEMKRNFIEKVIVSRLRQRARMEDELNKRRRWLMEHRSVSGGFLASLLTSAMELTTFHEHAQFIAEHEDEGLPDYLLWYNPWPDHWAHYKGPYADDIIGFQGEYDRLDFYLGKMLDVYDSVPTVSGRGATYADRTLLAVVSDHGLVYTPRLVSADELLFEGMRRQGLDVKYQKLTQDEGGLPAVHGREQVKPTRPFDAVVGSTAGGSYIIDLFSPAGLAGDAAAWERHPDYHDLKQSRLLSGQPVDWIEELKKHLRDSMDLALVRENGPAPGTPWPAGVDSVVRIVTPDRGEARVYRLLAADGEPQRTLYRYEILDGQDPLDLAGSARDYLLPPGGPKMEDVQSSLGEAIHSKDGHPDRHWQELLSYTLRPDVIYQFSHLYDSDRAGTINVFPLLHVGMNSGLPGRHAGEAFGEKNGTQLYRGAGLRRSLIQTARNGSLPVTIYHWLAGDDAYKAPEPPSGCPPAQQFGYRSLLDEPAFAPLR